MRAASPRHKGIALKFLLSGSFFLIAMLIWGCGRSGEAPSTSAPAFPQDTSEPGLSSGELIRQEAFISVKVLPGRSSGELRRVQIIPNEITLIQGESLLLSAIAYDQRSQLLSDVVFTWGTSYYSGATLSKIGYLVAGQTPGEFSDFVWVEATQKTPDGPITKRAYTSVTVQVGRALRSLAILGVIPEEVIVSTGGVFLFTGIAYDSSRQPIGGVRYRWGMENSAAGTISEFGYFVAGAKPGHYQDAVWVEGVQEKEGEKQVLRAYATVIIGETPREGNLELVLVMPQEITISGGEVFAFTATGSDSAGKPISGIQFRWRIARSEAGRINPLGHFTAGDRPGRYDNAIWVQAHQETKEGTITRQAFATVIVREPLERGILDHVNTAPKQVVLVPGEHVTFGAVGYNSQKQPTSGIDFRWESDDTAVGTITDFGVFRAGGIPGRYEKTIWVEATQQTEAGTVAKKAYVTIIIPGPLERIEVFPAAVESQEGEVVLFDSRGYDSAGIAIPGLVFTWTIVDERAGTIDAFGNFVAGNTPGEYPNAIKVEARQQYFGDGN